MGDQDHGDARVAVEPHKQLHNFSAGPAVLPEEVLLEAQKELFALPGVGMSILEISHRSKTFDAILADAKAGIKNLLNVPDNYEILFLQGGASLQELHQKFWNGEKFPG